jgi:hypothetical protein
MVMPPKSQEAETSMRKIPSDAKLTRLESSYMSAIEGALARKDFVSAAKLGADYDRRAALLQGRRKLSLRRGAVMTGSGRG